MIRSLVYTIAFLASCIGFSVDISAADTVGDSPDESMPADRVVGSWRIEFTPNRAIRSYEIKSNGTVVDDVGATGKLLAAKFMPYSNDTLGNEGQLLSQSPTEWRSGTRWYLRLNQDTSGCFELISVTSDGRLLVEHFNPSATELPRPDQIGIGTLVGVKHPGDEVVIGTDGPIHHPSPGRHIPLDELPPGAVDGFGDARLRHGAPVTSIAVSPDGKWIASGSVMGERRLWDAETGKLLQTFADNHQGPVPLIRFSPDGSSLVIFDGKLNCWNPLTGEKKFQFETEGSPVDICYSPDGAVLAVAANNTENVVLYDTHTGRVSDRIGGHRKHAISLAYSPDGKYLASIDESSILAIRAMENGSTIKRPDFQGKISFSPGAKQMAVHDGATLRLFKLEDMNVADSADRVLQNGLYADTMPRTARFSADSKRISWGNSIYDVSTGNQLVEHNGMMNGPAEWIPHREALATSGADGVVRVVDANSGETLLPAPEPTRVFNLLSNTAPFKYENNRPRLGHLAVQLFSNLWNDQGPASTTQNNFAFIQTSNSSLTTFGTHNSRLPSSGMDRVDQYAQSMSFKTPFVDFQVAGNGTQLVVLVQDRLEVWKLGGVGPQFILHQLSQFDTQFPDKPYQQLSQFAISPDGQEVAALITENLLIRPESGTGSQEAAFRQIFKVWSLMTGKEKLSRVGPVRRANQPKLDKFFYTHDSGGLANTNTNRPKFLATGPATLDDLDASPQDSLFKLVVGTDTTQKFHNVRLMSPDDRWMLTESRNQDLEVNQFSVIDLSQSEHKPLWHPEGKEFAVSHHGKWLAVCKWEWDRPATIEIRNSTNGALLTSYSGHLGPVNSLSFSNDNRSLATAGGDGTTMIWDLTRFEGDGLAAINTDEQLSRNFQEFIGEDSANQFRSLWRYALDDRLTIDFHQRLNQLLSPIAGRPKGLQLGEVILRVITLYELRGDEDSVLRLRSFSESDSFSDEQRSAALQSLTRLRLRFPNRFVDKTVLAEQQDSIYHAYWLVAAETKSNGYRKLLITFGPLERYLQMQLRQISFSKLNGPAGNLILDRPAFTFDTYQDDSLWDHPFENVDSFGHLNVSNNQIVMNGNTYTISDCPMNVVRKLLANPMGTSPLHRRNHPLQGAQMTAQAFARLLEDQIAQE